VEVAHIVRVHEHVQVPADRTRFVTDVAIQSGLAPLEVLECGAHGVRRDRELGCACTVRAQRARDMDRDGRRWAHSVRRSLSLAVGMTQPYLRVTGIRRWSPIRKQST